MSEQSSQSARDRSALYTPAAIIIAGALIAVGLFFGLSGKSGALAPNGAQPSVAVDIKKVNLNNEPYIGKADAPVVMAFWSDFQCPYCRAFEVGHPQLPLTPAIPEIVKQYVDAGKVKLVFKDYAFLGPDSIVDAEYSLAVWDLYPDKYFDWRTAMFEQQPQENSLSEADNEAHVMKVTAGIAGIDAAGVKARVTSKKAQYDASIAADQKEGEGFGITGTPAIIIGTQAIDGAQPFDVFKQAIEAELKK